MSSVNQRTSRENVRPRYYTDILCTNCTYISAHVYLKHFLMNPFLSPFTFSIHIRGVSHFGCVSHFWRCFTVSGEVGSFSSFSHDNAVGIIYSLIHSFI